MRVIAGEAKGRKLKTPRGSIRPTTELVRGAIFSIIQPLVADPWSILDLYAGSGALGIEALSRGAVRADFVESNPRHCSIIKENLTALGLAGRGRTFCLAASKALEVLDGPYDVVVLDPPYSDPSVLDLLDGLAASALITDHSVVVVEHTPHLTFPERIRNLNLYRRKEYGDTCLSVYRQEARS